MIMHCKLQEKKSSMMEVTDEPSLEESEVACFSFFLLFNEDNLCQGIEASRHQGVEDDLVGNS